MNYYLSVLKKYAVFSGRAQRAEYWYFSLFNVIIAAGLGVIGYLIGGYANIFYFIYTLAVLIPGIAVAVRRLHDTNHSGWWIFINLIPIIGIIILIVFLVRDSQPGQNQYGQNPKGVTVS